MMEGKSPVIEWDGKQSRDFTYVANVVDANLRACTAKGISGEVFNVACGSTTSVNDIVRELNYVLKTDIKAKYAPKRRGDVRKTRASIAKMKKLLGIRKVTGFKEGIKLTVEWFRNRR
jgi:UDP-N-acetylglucosamine 4-epimerase